MQAPISRIEGLPITLFGAIIGIAGLHMLIMRMSQHFHLEYITDQAFVILPTVAFLVLSFFYGVKIIKYRKAVIEELNHPIASNFFAAFSISLFLLSFLYLELLPQLAMWIWYIGVVIHFILLMYLLNSWIFDAKWKIEQMNPAWFLPAVGIILAPIGAVEFVSYELGWFFFSIGLVLWIVLLVISMYRLFFIAPLPSKLEPLLFIFINPPSLGFLSYLALTDQNLDEFSRILYYTGVFFTVLLLSQFIRFLKLPFSLTWWAYTFPLSAFANASFMMYVILGYSFYLYITLSVLALLTIIVAYMIVKTSIVLKNQSIV